MATLTDIEKATLGYATERRKLADVVQELNDQIEHLKKSKLAEIRKLVNSTAEKKSTLSALIQSTKELFIRPRTVVFHGVKIGLQKGKGKMEWEDDEQVVKMIRKHLPEMADELIKTTEKPIRSALNDLETSDLKKLGITVDDTGDQVLVKPTDSGVDKIVNALLKEAEEE